MNKIFFDNWESIVRTLIITILAYLTMIIILRISGKRSLSKMNAFDFVVTIALGSALSSVSLNKDVSLADGVLVFILLIAMQYLLTWITARNERFKNMITNQPTLLLYKGELLHDQMLKERIHIDEIYFAARQSGKNSLQEIDAIVLETTGQLTIISNTKVTEHHTLSNVRSFEKK